MATATARCVIASIVAAVVLAHAGPAAAQGTPSPCASIDVDILESQAATQYSAGFARAALALITKALSCKQDTRMYRLAVLYACTARDATSARLYLSKLAPSQQGLLIQHCIAQGVILGGAGGANPTSASATVTLQARAPLQPAPRSTRTVALVGSSGGVGCDKRMVDDLMYEAADAFMAGNARTALSTVTEALACKQDVSMIRMAAIYACVAHDDSAQRYYLQLPRQGRVAVKQRCLQENIQLVETAPRETAAASPPTNAASCTTANVNTLVARSHREYAAGSPKVALALVVQALGCTQNVLMYRTAAMFACAARDLPSAKLYFFKVPPEHQQFVEQRCQREGLNVRSP
jgi:hypothetical protein